MDSEANADGSDSRPNLDGLGPDEILDRLGDWLATRDVTHIREGAIEPWLRAHPASEIDACRAGWAAACDASARFVHLYRRAPWASGTYAVPMRIRQWRALIGRYATGRYEPAHNAPSPQHQALAVWLDANPGGDGEAFAAGWQAACSALEKRTLDATIIRGSTGIDGWLVWLQVYKTGRFARVTTGATWPERTSISTRVLQGSLTYLATGDEVAATRVFQGKASLTVNADSVG